MSEQTQAHLNRSYGKLWHSSPHSVNRLENASCSHQFLVWSDHTIQVSCKETQTIAAGKGVYNLKLSAADYGRYLILFK